MSIVQRLICTLPQNAKDDTFAENFGAIIGSQMKGVHVIFEIVSSELLAEEKGSGTIAFGAVVGLPLCSWQLMQLM